MKKSIVFSLALVSILAIASSASENSSIQKSMSEVKDTIIYLQGDSSDIPMMLHKEREFITLSPYHSQSSSPQDNGLTLDVPPNDDCANAQEIGEVDHLSASTREATTDGGDFSTNPNIWYLYTPSATDRMRAFIGFDENDHEGGGGKITIYSGSSCPEPAGIPQPSSLQGGEIIESAVPVSDQLPVAHYGSLDGYVRDYHDYSCGLEHSFVGPDAVYSYTPQSDKVIDIVLGEIDGDVNLVVMDEDSNELACGNCHRYENSEDNISGPAILNFPVTAGETYYLVLSGNYTDVFYNYMFAIFEPGYEIVDMSLGFRFTGAWVDFYAIAGNQYLIEVSYEHPFESSFLTIEPIPDPPVNDVCENAQDGGVLREFETIQFTGDNTAATMTVPFIMPYPEVWVKFTLEDTLTILMDYCGNTSIGDYIVQSFVMTQDCPFHSEGWYFGDSPFDILFCPNMSMLVWWDDLPPGTYYYPMLVHNDYEGYYSINITAMSSQECKEDVLFGQSPTSLRNPISDNYYYSDYEVGFACVDKFEDVTGPINEINWWGISADPSEEEIHNCDPEEPYTFQIVFCNLNQTSPYLPGDTAAVYDVNPEITETGFKLNNYTINEIPQRKYTAVLPDPVEMETGWIMIRGNDGINNCAFAWQNSSANFENGLIFDAIENSWSRTDESYAFCLGEGQVGIDDESEETPSNYELIWNYPNPFNATTSIQFSLKHSDDVTLSIYDIGGRLIKSVYDGSLSAGLHSVIWDGSNQSGETASSGIYFYRLQTSDEVHVNRMILLK